MPIVTKKKHVGNLIVELALVIMNTLVVYLMTATIWMPSLLGLGEVRVVICAATGFLLMKIFVWLIKMGLSIEAEAPEHKIQTKRKKKKRQEAED